MRDGRMRKRLILHFVVLLLVSLLVLTPINIASVAACRIFPNHEEAQARMNVVESLIELFQDLSELPNEAFENPANAEYQKNVLRYNVDAVMHYVMVGAYGSAINKLWNDIKKRIEEWILDPWKTDLIKKIQEIIGLIIELCRDWKPPTIVEVSRYPEAPEYYERVTVTANVVDEWSGVRSVILNYSVDTTDWVNVTMNLTEGLYVAEIPPLPYDTSVNYEIYAYDWAGNLEISETYSYVVIDSHPPTISHIESIPALPNYNETVTVYAGVTEPPSASGVKLVILSYWSISAWVNVTMIPEDGLYTAVIPALPYGTMVQYRVSASDYAGNWATSDVYSYNVTDIFLPLARINAPVQGSYVSGEVAISVFVYDENFYRAELTLNGMLVGSWSSAGEHVYRWNTATYDDGVYTIGLTAYDEAENIDHEEVTVTVDNTLPTALIMAPLDGSFLKDTVSVEFSGDDDNFDKMELYVGDVLVETFRVSGVKTYTWGTSINSDQTYKIALKVLDKAGNLATADITVTVDNTLPTAEITKPVGGAYLRGAFNVAVRGQDENFDRMELYINLDLVKTWTVGGAEIYAWDTTTFDDGSCTIKLVVCDKAGNTVDKTVTVTVDNTPPSIGTPGWDPEEPFADEEVDVSVTVTETVSGLRNVTLWYKTGGEWVSVEMALGDGEWTATIPGQGSGVVVKFYTEAYDNAGNGAETGTYEYTVKASAGWPMALIGAIGLGIAALTTILLYGLYRRRKKRARI